MHAKIENNMVVEYPITNLRQYLPNTSLPEDLTNDQLLPDGYVYVRYIEPPQFNPMNQKPVEKLVPELINGKWVIGYEIIDLTADELDHIVTNTRENAKAARQTAVDNIKVTTSQGHIFDGDETSQTRMARAILVLSANPQATIPWVLADNTVIQVNASELTEALMLAGQEQSLLWIQ